VKKQKICDKGKALLSQYGLVDLDLSNAESYLYEQGEFLSHAGEPINSVFIVVSGKAKVFINLASGKQLLLAYFTTKGMIGDIELVTSRPTNYTTVQAVTDFECIALPLNIYASVLKANNVFINHVARELAMKLTQRVINGAITTLHPLESRLCAYIAQTASDGVFRDTLTEVAIIVGTSYRHLLRCLSILCSKGILRKESSGYRIIDQQVLVNNAGDLYILK
jgi:CRP-like cAMP-binding protein